MSMFLGTVLSKGKVCINATNYIFNMDVMRAAAAVGVSVLDLGGLYKLTKEQLKLDQLMKDANILSIVGMGSDPGTSNIFSRYGVDLLDSAEEIHIRYGSSSSGVTFPFAIDTIIDEATKNAVAVQEGTVLEIPPLADEELTFFHEDVGAQKTYSIIHSELATLPDSFPELKTITYKDSWDPATIEKIKTLHSLGLLQTEPIEVLGENVSPRRQIVSLLQKLLVVKEEPIWGKDSLLVEVKGWKNGNKASVKLELLTDYQPKWKASATQYATAIPASIVAQMIINGEVTETGVKPPETCIDPKTFLAYLNQKNVNLHITYTETVTPNRETANWQAPRFVETEH
ncbi:saccharopine dehydrogenase C-terminal domain-containing protein [Neobacillus sp. OS1-33]|uniref:saccharopine dehydrogenase family protein n=1 Tax=Neobacillus sp. OS1-33 TaxID=3070683 RepID=UPI0027DFC49D|nr:saccharopine dehydrogenase C-terminal domain-containing protein [Neobacillus sp. OS1-33]WML26347.1 saccharopine dehydrogenase C-terminal domain-containing protein [Neobacillus sp. OS1-33]